LQAENERDSRGFRWTIPVPDMLLVQNGTDDGTNNGTEPALTTGLTFAKTNDPDIINAIRAIMYFAECGPFAYNIKLYISGAYLVMRDGFRHIVERCDDRLHALRPFRMPG